MSDVIGIGLDLCEISRMEALCGGPFTERFFTEAERAYLAGQGQAAAASLAGLWAAKEAVLKALGTGITVPLREVEILHGETGAPRVVLHGKAAELAGGSSLHLSITHEGNMAAAVCVRTAGEKDAK